MTVHTLRFLKLSPARQTLVRMLQAVNFGEIQSVRVRDGEPIFEPAPVVIIDAKLDKPEEVRAELQLPDFDLRDEVRRLMTRLDELKNCTILRLELHSGLPRRAIFELREPDTSDPPTAVGKF